MLAEEILKNTQQFKRFAKNAAENKLSHAYMFTCSDKLLISQFSGFAAELIVSQGKGDKLIAQRIKDGVYPDVIKIKNDKSIMVDDILKIVDTANLKPLEADCKVYVIEDAETMNTQAQNKLLKTLEEPPRNVYIILNVSNSCPILSTVMSRCDKISIELLKRQQIYDILKADYKCADDNLINRILSLCENKLGCAVDLLQKNDFSRLYDFALEIFTSMHTSADVLKYSTFMINRKDDIPDILNFMLIISRDMLALNSNSASDLVIIDKQELRDAAKNYSTDALLFITEKIMQAQKDLGLSCNVTAISDSVLLNILEGKYKWQKQQA